MSEKVKQSAKEAIASDTKVKQVLDKVPENVREEVVSVLVESYFAGPLPPPDFLREYENIIPGAADRILKLAEKEQDSRVKRISSVSFIEKLHTVGAIIVNIAIPVTLICGGGFFYAESQPITGGIVGGLSITPLLLRAFESWIKSKKDESNDK